MLKIEKFTDVCMTGGMHYTPSHTNVCKFYNFQLGCTIRGTFLQQTSSCFYLCSRFERQLANFSTLFVRGNHSRPQRPRPFWSAPRIATSGHVQHRKSAIHGLPVTLRMLRVKSHKSDRFWSHSIVFTILFKTGISLDRARGHDSWC